MLHSPPTPPPVHAVPPRRRRSAPVGNPTDRVDLGPADAAPLGTRLLLRSTHRALAERGLGDGHSLAHASTPASSPREQARHRLEALLRPLPTPKGADPPRPAGAPPAWSPAHLAGWLEAARGHCLAVPSQSPVVVMASAGGHRQLPVLTPLLALWLAREGVRVLLHGPLTDHAGVTCAEVLRTLGLSPATQAADVRQAWSRREPAFIPTSTLCPAMTPLLQRAHGAAWRNLARRLVRLLNPIEGAPALLVAHHGSHDTRQLLAGWAQAEGAAVMLLCGAEGEPVADLRRRPRIDSWLDGQRQPDHSCAAQGRSRTAPPLWPQQADAATTALYVQAVLSGERPAPAPLATQVDLIQGLMRHLQGRL